MREDLRSELFARNVDTLEKAYASVQLQDLDKVRSPKNQDYKASVSRPRSQSYQNRATSSASQPQTDNKSKNIERSIPKSNPQTTCYKCQGYGHIVVKCDSPYKITLIDREGYPESNTDKYIHQVDGDEDFDENTEENAKLSSIFRVHQIIDSQVYLDTTEG